jgi:hypothetical protein
MRRQARLLRLQYQRQPVCRPASKHTPSDLRPVSSGSRSRRKPCRVDDDSRPRLLPKTSADEPGRRRGQRDLRQPWPCLETACSLPAPVRSISYFRYIYNSDLDTASPSNWQYLWPIAISWHVVPRPGLRWANPNHLGISTPHVPSACARTSRRPLGRERKTGFQLLQTRPIHQCHRRLT